MKKLLLSVIALFSFVCLFAADVALVKNGKAMAVIVIENDNVSTKKAGEELQQMLEKRTGAKLQILSAKDKIPAGMIPVYLGLSARTAKLGADEKKLKYDAYFFKVTPDYVVIAGRDIPQTNEGYHGHNFIYCNYQHHYYAYGEKGTLNGVYKSLEKYAGNRHYMPGELGEIVPRSPDFVLPVTEYINAPAFRERYVWGVYFKTASVDYMRWYYRMCSGGQNNNINHSYRGMQKYKDSNPEFFALIGGQRDFKNLSTANQFGNLCMTNPEGIKKFASHAQKFFDRNPTYNTYPVVPQDGMYKICECANCRKLYSPHLGHTGRFSNAVFYHAAEIAKILAKTHPGKMIGTLAYEGYRVPPEMDLPPNLAVRICYTRQSLRDPKQKKLVEDAIKGFHKKKVPILVWTYPLFNHRPPMRGLPIFYPAIMQENIRFNRDHGVVGEFSEGGYSGGTGDSAVRGGTFAFPGTTHLNDYIRCQLMWDPDLDMKATLEEYYRLFYGPAAAEMKEYWTTGEKLFMKYGEATMYTTEDLKMFEAILKRAAAKAPAGSVYAKRIQLIRDEVTPIFKTMYMLRSKGKFFGVSYTKEEIPMEYNIDGVWKHAREYTLTFKDGRTVPGKDKTKLYALANDKGLAFHVICNEQNPGKLIALAGKRDEVGKAWRDDCLEFFIVTADRKENRHYFVTAKGQVVDAKRTIDVNVADWAWNGGMKVKTVIDKKSHTYTVFIPWSDLGCTFNDLPKTLFQLFRRQNNGDYKNVIYQSLFPTTGFHNYSPEYFAPIEFLGDENRLHNGNFEEFASPESFVGWAGHNVKTQDRVFEGKFAVRLAGNKSGNQSLYSGKIAVTEDCDYSLTLRHYGTAAFVYVLFYDKNGKGVEDPARKFFWTNNSKAWRTVVFQGRVPAKAVACSIVLRNFSAGKAGGSWIDNVEFRGGVKFLPQNPNFRNGSFETLAPDGKPANWSRPCNLETSAVEGKYAVRVSGKGGPMISSGKFAVTGGSDFQLKAIHFGSGGYIYVICYDANGKNLGAPYYYVPETSVWKRCSIAGKLPANAVKCEILLRNFTPSAANGTWFDDIKFYSK
ncbi:MAG: DUF4838 domain-containing protein [Lentisphaeria bacterium]|nr:DUF4838 domain-containing protein [Lentisphaeria bacterium]